MDYMEEIDHAAFGPRQGNGANKRKVDHTWLTLLGAVATVCGTIAAILSVPDDPVPAGALFWPAVWCSLGLLTAPVLGLRKTTQAILRAENLLMIGLIYWLLLDLLQGAYPLEDVTYNDVILALTAIGAMATGILVGMVGTGWQPPQLVLRAAKQQFSSTGLFRAVWVAFFLGMFHFAYSSDFDPSLMINALGWCRFCAPWSTGAFGGWEAFIVHLQYFGYVLPSLTVLLAYREGWARPKTIVASIVSIIMVAFLAQGGGRRIIGVVVGAALITWSLLQERIRPRTLVGGLIAVAILLVFMEEMLQFRKVGLSDSDEDYVSELAVHVDDNFLQLSQIIHFIPNVQPYVDLQPLAYALSLPIPRALWPGKPSDPGYDLPELLGWSGVSLSTSIVGELYAMHGLLVVFLGGLVFGRIANMWNKVLAVPGMGKSMIYGFGAMVLFAGLRSMQDLVIMSYGLLAWLVIARLLRRARGKALPRPS
jgi:hypothetical protein